MVIGVIYEIIRDGVTMAGVELLEECLGCFLLLEAELIDEAICLDFPKTAYLTKVKVRGDRLDGVQLIRTYRILSGLTIRCADGDIDSVITEPGLRRLWNTRVTGFNS